MLHEDAKATLLLTGRFGKQDESDAKPLSPNEWGRFAAWLHSRGAAPRDLLACGASDLLDAWTDKNVTRLRIDTLLGRGVAMSLALEKWQSAGLWVMTRSDGDYPRSLKHRLREASPPVLFGCGDRSLLGQGGLVVVGSRDADDAALSDAGALAAAAARDGIPILSGGARGVDETAMIAALDAGGVAVGVLANNLLRASTGSRYRRALRDGRLVLVSPFQPEARFLAGNAMARNKYIYCLADAAVVISTAHESGGTWSGAMENLKRQWVALYVRRSAAPGHEALVKVGGQWLPDDLVNVRRLVEGITETPTSIPARNTSCAALRDGQEVSETAPGDGATSTDKQLDDSQMWKTQANQSEAKKQNPPCDGLQTGAGSFYELFIEHLRRELQFGRVTAKILAERLDLPKPLVDRWLKQAVHDGIAEKKGRPVQFQLPRQGKAQQSFL